MNGRDSHRDYEPFELAENMEEDLGLFEAAVKPREAPLDLGPQPCILLVTDGSNQDPTAQTVAARAQSALSAEIVTAAATSLEDLEQAESILARAADASAGLLVLPVPLGEDITELESLSLGSAADCLLQLSSIPMLCIREPLADGELDELFDTVLVAISRNDPRTREALAWAFRLAKREIVLCQLADRDSMDEARQLLEGRQEDSSVEQAVVQRAVNSRLGPLVGIAQRYANRQDIGLHVDFRLGSPARQVPSAAQASGSSLVIAPRLPDPRESPDHVVQDILLALRLPVLVV